MRHYVQLLRDRGYLFGTHFLPHDAEHQRLSDYNRCTFEMLQDLLPGQRFVVVPRITELINGIHQTRKHLKGAFFDKNRCAKGIMRLDAYRKKFSRADNRYINQPDKSNGASEGADALRQWAQAKELGLLDLKTGSYEEADAPDWRL